jgi:transglutaminase-like putative cysteine protease
MHLANSLHTEPLLDGDPGTVQTIAKIREYVHQGKNDPIVNEFTGRMLRAAGVPSYDRGKEVRAIFAWVLRNIRFMADPVDAECLRWARTTLEWGFGDCDDINAILLPSMLKTAGHHVRLITIASHPAAPEQFSHIYCEANVDGKWIPLDAARSGTRFGSAPARHYRKRVWSLEDASYQDLRGLGCGAGCDRNCAGCTVRRRMKLGTHYRDALGRYYRASGLGQDGFDWSTFTDVLNAAGKATTSIIGAARAPGGIVYPSMPGYPPPQGFAPGIYPGGGVSAVGSISSNTMVLIGLGLAGVLLLTRRNG